ncbi:hypothetical protein GLYMA_U031212v4 [Glycine max]|nr:hypothetical protein GLYMA_U031212v4 [Glycine max]KAH1137581.1 hypothetical protein GYH30_027540 [Glycine max]
MLCILLILYLTVHKRMQFVICKTTLPTYYSNLDSITMVINKQCSSYKEDVTGKEKFVKRHCWIFGGIRLIIYFLLLFLSMVFLEKQM